MYVNDKLIQSNAGERDPFNDAWTAPHLDLGIAIELILYRNTGGTGVSLNSALLPADKFSG